jgi:hypothetical protein
MIPIPPLAGPRALEALGPYDAPFFKELKCYFKRIIWTARGRMIKRNPLIFKRERRIKR